MIAPQIRTRTCVTCDQEFSYPIGKGTDRKHCSEDCRNKTHARLSMARFERLPACGVEGCGNKATRVQHGMCEMHYLRLLRKGTTAPRQPKYRYVTGFGYVKLLEPEHPLADTGGYVYEHRMVAYDTHNGTEMHCYWCNELLPSWRNTIIDHLNDSKGDNRAENLVLTCNACNRARGSMLPFLDAVQPARLDEVMAWVRERIESRQGLCAQHGAEKSGKGL